jgi:hypothetical protein
MAISLQELIDRIREAGEGIAKRVATASLPEIKTVIEANIVGQRDPYGNAWPERKDSRYSGPMLVNAGTYIDYSATDKFIILRLSGYDVYHHKGYRGNPKRQILPDSGSLPENIKEVIKKQVTVAVREIITGKR